MALISQPGSDCQLAEITLDAGHARDIICLLLDVHAVLDHLWLDGTQPEITTPGADYLRESDSPCTLPAAHQRPRRSDQPAHPGDARRSPGHPRARASPPSRPGHLLTPGPALAIRHDRPSAAAAPRLRFQGKTPRWQVIFEGPRPDAHCERLVITLTHQIEQAASEARQWLQIT